MAMVSASLSHTLPATGRAQKAIRCQNNIIIIMCHVVMILWLAAYSASCTWIYEDVHVIIVKLTKRIKYAD